VDPPRGFLRQKEEDTTNDESDEAEEEHVYGCQSSTKHDDSKDSERS
jgi:hypothetical protein